MKPFIITITSIYRKYNKVIFQKHYHWPYHAWELTSLHLSPLLLIKCTLTAPLASKSLNNAELSKPMAIRSGTGAVGWCMPSGDDVITTISSVHTWPLTWWPSPCHFRLFWWCLACHRRPDSQVWILSVMSLEWQVLTRLTFSDVNNLSLSWCHWGINICSIMQG